MTLSEEDIFFSNALIPSPFLLKTLKIANGQIEEMRRKFLGAQSECKKLERTLVKELGDGASLEHALSDDWRGVG